MNNNLNKLIDDVEEAEEADEAEEVDDRKTAHGKPRRTRWTADEEKELKICQKKKMSPEEMATKFGRSVAAINSKIKHHAAKAKKEQVPSPFVPSIISKMFEKKEPVEGPKESTSTKDFEEKLIFY